MEYAREMRQKQAWRSSGEKIISVMDSYAKRGGKPGLSNATKAILSRLPSKQKVDLRPFLNDLTTETLWELSAALTDCAEINLAGWEDLVPNGLRAIALNCGSTLETINFEGCPITDAMVKVSVIRLFALRSLNLSHCVGITDLSMQSLATGCKDTIRSLSICRFSRRVLEILEKCIHLIYSNSSFFDTPPPSPHYHSFPPSLLQASNRAGPLLACWHGRLCKPAVCAAAVAQHRGDYANARYWTRGPRHRMSQPQIF